MNAVWEPKEEKGAFRFCLKTPKKSLFLRFRGTVFHTTAPQKVLE